MCLTSEALASERGLRRDWRAIRGHGQAVMRSELRLRLATAERREEEKEEEKEEEEEAGNKVGGARDETKLGGHGGRT